MKVVSGIALVTMPVRLRLQRDRNEAHLPVRDAAFGDNAIGEASHRLCLSAKHGNLETVLVVEMRMQRRHVEMMMIVMRAGQPLRKFAGVVVEHVRERGEALAADVRAQPGVLQAKAGEVRKASERLA